MAIQQAAAQAGPLYQPQNGTLWSQTILVPPPPASRLVWNWGVNSDRAVVPDHAVLGNAAPTATLADASPTGAMR